MTEKIDTILTAAREHCAKVIKPNIDQWNENAKWPRDASDLAGAAGLTGLYCPEEFGGQGLSLGDGIRVYEELGMGDGAYAFTLSMHNICAYAACGFGTDTFKNTWAKDLIAGRKLANFALTEPQSGSDPANMHTRATVNDDGSYTVSGAKAWVSLATKTWLCLPFPPAPTDCPSGRSMTHRHTPSCPWLKCIWTMLLYQLRT